MPQNMRASASWCAKLLCCFTGTPQSVHKDALAVGASPPIPEEQGMFASASRKGVSGHPLEIIHERLVAIGDLAQRL
jgi:hypothetical protein